MLSRKLGKKDCHSLSLSITAESTSKLIIWKTLLQSLNWMVKVPLLLKTKNVVWELPLKSFSDGLSLKAKVMLSLMCSKASSVNAIL